MQNVIHLQTIYLIVQTLSLIKSMDRRTVYISSKNRTTGTPDDFIIADTKQRFAVQPQSIKAKTITIPHTWNNITATNNYFEFEGTMSGVLSFIVPEGNYTGESLATELTRQFNIVTAGTTCGGYEVTYSIATQKFTLTSVAEMFSMDFTISNNMADVLGFPEAVTASASSHTSSVPANIIIDTEIWVCTDVISGTDNGVIPWTDSKPQEENILACVPINACFGSIINYTVPIEFPYYTIRNSAFVNNNVVPRPLRVFLKFPSGAPLSLNGNDWSMQVIFDFNKST